MYILVEITYRPIVFNFNFSGFITFETKDPENKRYTLELELISISKPQHDTFEKLIWEVNFLQVVHLIYEAAKKIYRNLRKYNITSSESLSV